MDWILNPPVAFLPVAVACLVIFAGAVMQAATGMAAGLVMAPVLLLIDPIFVPGPILLSGMSLNLMMMRREWTDLRREGLKAVIIGMLLGATLGAMVMGQLAGPPVRILSGVLILGAVGASFLGFRFPETRTSFLVVGALSNFIGIIAAVGGSVLALLYQHHPGPVVRSTLALLYLIACVFMVGLLIVVGRFGLAELYVGLTLLPGWFLGFHFAKRIARFLDDGYTRIAILVIAGGSSLFLIVQNLALIQS